VALVVCAFARHAWLTLALPHPDRYAHAKYWICDKDTDEGHVGMSTGNWSPTDYPAGTVFPPYPSAGWQDVRASLGS